MTFDNCAEDPVNGLIAWNCHIQYEEMPENIKKSFLSYGSPLQPLGNVVPSATRVNHCSKVSHVLLIKIHQFDISSYRQIDEVARLVQTVEPLLFDDSAEELVGDLNEGQLSRVVDKQQPWHGMDT